MDQKQLIKDIFTLNVSAFATRYHKLVAVIKRKLFGPGTDVFKEEDLSGIPIIINNRNRLTYLKQLVDWLQNAGYTNIYILDNNSNYGPLLEYYQSTQVNVIRLESNYGHLSLWKSGIYKKFYSSYYVYTDPDVLPIETCPPNFMQHFLQLLKKYPGIEKVGFGLKIDDLPSHYQKKEKVIEWESKFWLNEVEKEVYNAPIDTTFALYKPFTRGDVWVQNALRTGGNYVCRHLPWYEDSANLPHESIFYQNNMKQGASHWILKDENKLS
jgi:hypothetical protein